MGDRTKKLDYFATDDILNEVFLERTRQHSRWGEQNHPDGTGSPDLVADADRQRKLCDEAFKAKTGTYRHILAEEVAEAFAESDQEKLREELVQVAAVAVAWIESIDRRKPQKKD